jgi:3-methyladenine DNA glycosylase AlkD
MSWHRTVLDATEGPLRLLADPKYAIQMSAYMRDQFPFLGVATPARRTAVRAALQGLPVPNEAELDHAVRHLWALPEREFAYVGCDLLARYQRVCSPDFLAATGAELITTNSWWDTVDGLGSGLVGPLVARFPELQQAMRAWIESDNIWLTRSAIIHQLAYKSATDTAMLFDFCDRRAADREFFIAKAIGWALRQYSYTDPVAVRSFVEDHQHLTPLSRREALKALERQARRNT